MLAYRCHRSARSDFHTFVTPRTYRARACPASSRTWRSVRRTWRKPSPPKPRTLPMRPHAFSPHRALGAPAARFHYQQLTCLLLRRRDRTKAQSVGLFENRLAIASASAARIVVLRLMYALTYCAGHQAVPHAQAQLFSRARRWALQHGFQPNQTGGIRLKKRQHCPRAVGLRRTPVRTRPPHRCREPENIFS